MTQSRHFTPLCASRSLSYATPRNRLVCLKIVPRRQLCCMRRRPPLSESKSRKAFSSLVPLGGERPGGYLVTAENTAYRGLQAERPHRTGKVYRRASFPWARKAELIPNSVLVGATGSAPHRASGAHHRCSGADINRSPTGACGRPSRVPQLEPGKSRAARVGRPPSHKVSPQSVPTSRVLRSAKNAVCQSLT
jgi:hypothetical protein